MYYPNKIELQMQKIQGKKKIHRQKFWLIQLYLQI